MTTSVAVPTQLPAPRRCFVISPIGPPDSDIREDADDVLDYIIEPALQSLGIQSVRSDRLDEPGLITEQMISAILNYDLCIVDLSRHNPNVFYELALAQAAERPVVILKRAGEAIPFDVKDYRLIEYDLKPRSLKTDRWVSVLKGQIQRVLDAAYKPPKLLPPKIKSQSDGIRSYIINARSEEFGEAPRYHEVAQRADEYCCFLGITLKSWANEDGRRVLEGLSKRGVRVKVLIMDGAHPGLSALINVRLPAEDLEAVRRQAERMAMFFESLAAQFPRTFEFRRIGEGIPHFQLLLSEQTALVLQYMFGRGTSASPLQQFPKGSQLHRAFREEFDTLWEINAPGVPRPNGRRVSTRARLSGASSIMTPSASNGAARKRDPGRGPKLSLARPREGGALTRR